MEEEKKKEYFRWYRDNYAIYSSFCNKVRDLIKDLIEVNQIPYHSITSRVKEEDSFIKKCDKEKYIDPISEIMDIAGIRVIAYINSDVDAICKIIRNEFTIDIENSINKAEQLDENEVGYLSIHYVASLNNNRLNLSEYKKFKGTTMRNTSKNFITTCLGRNRA